MNATEAAMQYLDSEGTRSATDQYEAHKTLSDEAKKEVRRIGRERIFSDANAQMDRRKEHLSDSGRYRLVVTPFATKPGCWNYSRGEVFRVGTESPIARIDRNYGSFPFAFIEDHPTGKDFFLAGEDYQGQSVVDLTTGQRRDLLPEEALKGMGFCWASYHYVPEWQAILVDGCYWACPYEFRFYDFSDPMNGWPQIGDDIPIDSDDRKPEFNGDTVKVFETREPSDYYEEDPEEDPKPEDKEVGAFKVYRREGLALVEIESWVSEREAKARADREESNRKYQEWLETFRSTDALYLAMAEGAKDPIFKGDTYDSVGRTYDDWCPDWKGNERRMCRRIHYTKSQGYTFDLEWATEMGPIKLTIFKDGKSHETRFFPHSVEGMQETLGYAKSLLTGGAS